MTPAYPQGPRVFRVALIRIYAYETFRHLDERRVTRRPTENQILKPHPGFKDRLSFYPRSKAGVRIKSRSKP